jgi:hypothetical protein
MRKSIPRAPVTQPGGTVRLLAVVIATVLMQVTSPAAAHPSPEQLAAIGAHVPVGPLGPIGVSSSFLVHVSPDRRAGLALTVAHGDPRVGDLVGFQSLDQGEVRGTVMDVVAQSTRLDYSLLSLRFDKPIAAKPIPVVGDHLPTTGKVTSAGWGPGPGGIRMHFDENEMLGRPGIGRINVPNVARGLRDAVPAGLLNPLLFFTPLGGMPVNIGFNRAPDVRRVTVAAFRLNGGPGMSGGPILDGAGRAVAHIHGGSSALNSALTVGVPTALVVRDVARRVSGLYGTSKTMVTSWLAKVPHTVRGGHPFK